MSHTVVMPISTVFHLVMRLSLRIGTTAHCDRDGAGLGRGHRRVQDARCSTGQWGLLARKRQHMGDKGWTQPDFLKEFQKATKWKGGMVRAW